MDPAISGIVSKILRIFNKLLVYFILLFILEESIQLR
jgi:hypothetical protein